MSKKKKKEYYELLERLAAAGDFDAITIPVNTKNCRTIDEHYPYIPRNIFVRIFTKIVRGFLILIAPLLNFFICKPKIVGREHLKNVASAITVSNHVFFLDNLVVRQAVRGHKLYVTVAPFNCKKGVGGAFLRAGGILPFSENLSATRNLYKAMKELFQKGAYIHVYAEQSMWLRYEKNRPFKKGAFTIAVQQKVPVVPMIFLFRERKGIEKIFHHGKIVTLKILPPIFAEEGLSVNENAQNMMEKASKAYEDAVIAHYGYQKEGYSIYDAPKESLRYR